MTRDRTCPACHLYTTFSDCWVCEPICNLETERDAALKLAEIWKGRADELGAALNVQLEADRVRRGQS